jgi:hypothetical protein
MSLLKKVLAEVPRKKAELVKRGSTLPVDVKRDIIKELYGNIGEKMFGFSPDKVQWMHRMIDQMMSDSDVSKEWEFIQKGNVEKLLKLMMQIRQQAGPEDAPELEEMANLWESIARGIVQTKQAHREINQKEWDFAEDHLMKFVDKFSDKLSQKSGQALPGGGKKQLSGSYPMLAAVLSTEPESGVAKLLAKRVKSAAPEDISGLAQLEKELGSMGRRMLRLVKELEQYVVVPTNIHLMPKDIMLYAGDIQKEKHKLEQEIHKRDQAALEEIAKSGKKKGKE